MSAKGTSMYLLEELKFICLNFLQGLFTLWSFSLKALVQELSQIQVIVPASEEQSPKNFTLFLLPEQCLGAPQEKTFLLVCMHLVIECEFPLDASAKVSLWKTSVHFQNIFH